MGYVSLPEGTHAFFALFHPPKNGVAFNDPCFSKVDLIPVAFLRVPIDREKKTMIPK